MSKPTRGAIELREAYGYATNFLQAFCENNSLRQVDPLPTLCGVLTQIDNATTIIRTKDRDLLALRAAWKIAEPHLPQDVYRRALAALDASR